MHDLPVRSRHGWVVIVFAVAAAALFLRLGAWQLSRLSDRRALNAVRESAAVRPTIDLGSGVVTTAIPAESILWRRVVLTGRWDHRHEFVVRGRAYYGTPGVQVATLFRTVDGSAVLVLRGWLPAADGLSADLTRGSILSDTGLVSVRGLALPFESKGPIPGRTLKYPDGERFVVGTLDLESVSSELDEPLVEWFLQILPLPAEQVEYSNRLSGSGAIAEFDTSIRPLPAPELNDGPHALYAFQWFGFALIALAGAIFLPRAARAGTVATPGPGDES